MSATLTATIESLHIAAARKLLELIQTEKDPHLLARLIATAFRFKLGKPGGPEKAASPRVRPAASSPAAAAADDDEAQPDDDRTEPPPPYTDQQYLDLIRHHGPVEAGNMRQRRLALIAHLSRRGQIAASTG